MIRWIADLPIERKLRLVITVPAMAAFSIAMMMHIATNLLHLREDMQRRTLQIAHEVGAETLDALTLGATQAALHASNSLRDEPSVSIAEILDLQGRRLASYSRGKNDVTMAPRPLAQPQGAIERPPDANHPRLYFDTGLIHAVAAIDRGGKILGYVHIAAPLEALYSDWRSYLLIAFAAVLAAIVTSYWLAAGLQRQISGPIVNLARTMQRVSVEEDYSLRVERNSLDEIGLLIDGFNQMLEQIRHRDLRLEKYRQFLEQQVEERTVNLANANRDLQAAIDEATRAKDAAERASSTKSDFLARMSHEIRTPMNGVMGMSELLQGTELNSHQRRLSETISRSAEALLQIINDILDFSKIEAGKMELERTEFNLREVVEETIEILAEIAHSKGLELACFIDGTVPVEVRADPTRLRQILINLIGNAIKFTQDGEVVVRVTAADAQGLLRFEVVDTGIGIPQEAQHRIFNAFSQADSFTTRKYGGTGLGLAIVKQLVALMGGEIQMRSVPDQGSTFWFEVRVEPLAETAPTLSRMPRSNLVGLRALVVDDNASNREIVQQHLQTWGVKVELADSGRRALSVLEGNPTSLPDLVILDHQMPVMDGLEVAMRIRANPTLEKLRLVMLSSREFNESALGHAHLFDAALAKPLRRSQLFSCLSRAMTLSTKAAPDSGPASFIPTGFKILVVEDNHVNRAVAVGMLESLGYSATSADNGRAAIDAMSKVRFDAVLMDCQMPVMDGMTATSEIRDREQRIGGARTLIIALTANAMEGDRERCLAAGMDDFLSKPFTRQQLANLLSRWQLPHSTMVAKAEAAERGAAESAPLIDAKVLRDIENVGRPELLGAMIDLYLEHSPSLIQNVESAAAERNVERLYQAVHSLKSSTANLGGRRLATVAADCESRVRKGDISRLEVLIAQIKREYHEFCGALTRERSLRAA